MTQSDRELDPAFEGIVWPRGIDFYEEKSTSVSREIKQCFGQLFIQKN